MNVKKYTDNNIINIKGSPNTKGSPTLKENNGSPSSKYMSLLKNKHLKNPLKEKSKNSIIYNNYNNRGSPKTDKIPKNNDNIKTKKNSTIKATTPKIINSEFYNNDNNTKIIYNSNKKIEQNNVAYNSPGSNKIKHYYTNSNMKQKLMSPGSPVNKNFIDNFVNYNNYNGSIINLINNIKITEKCMNNDGKKSKFYIKEDSEFKNEFGNWGILRGTCSKCAVKLANLGYVCEEIFNDLLSIRKNRIETFCNDFENLKTIITPTEETLYNYKNTIKQLQSEQINTINKNFDSLIKYINGYKYELESYVNSQYNNELDTINNAIIELNKKDEEITASYYDTHKNYNKIIRESFEENNFEEIFSKYESNIKDLYNNYNIIRNKKSVLSVIALNKNKYNKVLEKIKTKIFEFGSIELLFENIDNYVIPSNEIRKSNKNNLSQIDDNASRSNVIISFDEKNCQSVINVDNDDESYHEPRNSTHKYSKMLDKIENSQRKKESFYHSFLKNNNSDNNLKTDLSNKILLEENMNNEKMFVFDDNDDDWDNKQTPQLGEKEEVPEHIMNIKAGISDAKKKPACNKTLF